MTANADDLIENSSLTSQRVRDWGSWWCASLRVWWVVTWSSKPAFLSWQEEIDKKEKMTAGLNQTVRELQQLLQAVSRQLAKGQEEVRPVMALFFQSNKIIVSYFWSPESEHSAFVISCRRLTKICLRYSERRMGPPPHTQPLWLHYRDHLWPSVSSLPLSHHTVTPSHPLFPTYATSPVL